jgi:hypothetical protein
MNASERPRKEHIMESKLTKMTIKQTSDLVKIYLRHKSFGVIRCSGLKTGWALERKGFVKLSVYQLRDWTQWEITESGIKYVEDQKLLEKRCDNCFHNKSQGDTSFCKENSESACVRFDKWAPHKGPIYIAGKRPGEKICLFA